MYALLLLLFALLVCAESLRLSSFEGGVEAFLSAEDASDSEAVRATLRGALRAAPNRLIVRGEIDFLQACAIFGETGVEYYDEALESSFVIERVNGRDCRASQGTLRAIVELADEESKPTADEVLGSVEVSLEEATRLAVSALRGRGCSAYEAETTVRGLVEADVDGKAAHGLRRLEELCEAIDRGDIRVNVKARVRKKGAVVYVDGCGGLAWPARLRAMPALERVARRRGVAVLLVTRTCSVSGRLAPVVEHLARNNFVALAAVNTPAYVAWPGARRGLVLGTNPIAFGAPNGNDPLVVDMSLAAMSRGDIEVKRDRRETLGPGIAVDAAGHAMSDPAAALARGALLPAGGLKGAFLALLVEILAGVLTGSDLAIDADDYHKMNRGQFVLALDCRRQHSSAALMERLVGALPFVPGERSRAARDKHATTVSLAASTYFFELVAARANYCKY